jgi:CubicO group peptidase (beta-lactamase class C family)
MLIKELKRESFRTKLLNCYDDYLNLSKDQTIAIGIYKQGNYYMFGNGVKDHYMYDIGSISKTITAHLILKLCDEKVINVNDRIDKYLKLKDGIYPTINELLSHSAGYNNVTPFEITVPNLLRYGYSKKNIYEKVVRADIIKALQKRRRHKYKNKYGYSDFAYAVLALVAEEVSGTEYSKLLFEFIRTDLKMDDSLITFNGKRFPLSIKKGKELPCWKWKLDNPYIASGGVVSNLKDMLKYISVQIESNEGYIVNAHEISVNVSTKNNLKICKGWHSYEKSNQLWHVGGVGTFRSSIIVNKRSKIGVIVLGNTKGVLKANVHYISKMIYSELKIRKIKLTD